MFRGVAHVAWKLKPLSLTAVVNFMAVLLIERKIHASVSQYSIGGSPVFPSRRTECIAAGSEGYKAGKYA